MERKLRQGNVCWVLVLVCFVLVLVSFSASALSQSAQTEAVPGPEEPIHRLSCGVRSLRLRPQSASPYLGIVAGSDLPLVLGKVESVWESIPMDVWRVYSARNDEIGYVLDERKKDRCVLLDAWAVAVEDSEAVGSRYEAAHVAWVQETLQGSSWLISWIDAEDPDSAGGNDLTLGYAVTDSEKILRSLRVYATAYDGVGDPITDRIRDVTQRVFEIKGPKKASEGEQSARFPNAWYYLPGIACVEIDRVEIESIDRQKYTYVNDLPQVLGPWLVNDCSYEGQKKLFARAALEAARAAFQRAEETSSDRFIPQGDTVIDRRLSVEWTRTGAVGKGIDAQEVCPDRGEGWRLPSFWEAQAIHYPLRPDSDAEGFAKVVIYEGSKPAQLRLYDLFEVSRICLWALDDDTQRLGSFSSLTGEIKPTYETYTQCDTLCLRPLQE